MLTDYEVNKQRQYYPRGLNQPEGCFRFSIDALLLAAFSTPAPKSKILDLGCGCGVVGFGLLFNRPEAEATGVDIEPDLIKCAQENAQMLGLEERYRAIALDLKKISKSCLKPESFDAVVSNPPFRRKNQGRLPDREMRTGALFESHACLEDFIKAAAFALKNQGGFYCIFSSERLAELFLLLQKDKLEPKLLQPLQARAHKECGLILLKAVKNGRPGLKLKAPILVYELGEEGTQPSLTKEILAFCPWLGCNAKHEVKAG